MSFTHTQFMVDSSNACHICHSQMHNSWQILVMSVIYHWTKRAHIRKDPTVYKSLDLSQIHNVYGEDTGISDLSQMLIKDIVRICFFCNIAYPLECQIRISQTLQIRKNGIFAFFCRFGHLHMVKDTKKYDDSIFPDL